MATTLGDNLYDIITGAVSDVVSEANRREEDLQDKIDELEKMVEELESKLAEQEA